MERTSSPLAWATGSYESLEAAGPWLATAVHLPWWLVTLLGLASGLWLTSQGLMAVPPGRGPAMRLAMSPRG